MKKLVADLSLDKQILQDVIKKSFDNYTKASHTDMAYFKIQDLGSESMQIHEVLEFDVSLTNEPT